jgi:hypothetical protein
MKEYFRLHCVFGRGSSNVQELNVKVNFSISLQGRADIESAMCTRYVLHKKTYLN